MQIGSLYIGLCRKKDNSIAWECPLFEYIRCYEGCHIISLWIIGISWLEGSCR